MPSAAGDPGGPACWVPAWRPPEQKEPPEGRRLQKPFANEESTAESASTLSEALRANHAWTAMFSKSRDRERELPSVSLGRNSATPPSDHALCSPQPDFIQLYFFTQDEGLASRKLNQDLLRRQDRASTPREVPRLPHRPAKQSCSLRALEGSAMLLTSEASPEEFPGVGDSRRISVPSAFVSHS